MDFGTSLIIIMVFIVVYVILIQIFSALFRITGLTKEKATFQSISLLTNCGFTTSESEIITSDKLRRRIALSAMITGYTFSVVIVSLIINVLFSIKESAIDVSIPFIATAFGLFVIILIILQLPIFKNSFEKLIELLGKKLLRRSNQDNIITLLDNYGKDAIAEIYLNRVPDFLVDKTIAECRIKDKFHMNILMLKRGGKIVDVNKDTIFKQKDSIVVFGSIQGIKNCFSHKKKETRKNVIDLIEEYGEEAMVEVQLNNMPEFLVNKGLYESGLKMNYNINLLAVKRKDQVITISKDTILEKHDTIVVFGPFEKIRSVFSEHEEKIEE